MRAPAVGAAIAPHEDLTPAQRRRVLIERCRRRARPGTGSGAAFLQERTALDLWPDLRSLLEGIPWTIAGAMATHAYMPERATHDLDILIRREDSERVRERLEAAGYRWVSPWLFPASCSGRRRGEKWT
ncbi:MAG: hypothetical protein RML46_11185 [Anaerolineae bacterium]|nr:nucleotidyltransferase family protein [Anaerolineae bacterium]MDW8069466.1 hypothetical protein [Anaerolineae bacterium]